MAINTVCELCGKDCKTAQGLAGHRQWVHGLLGAKPRSSTGPSAIQQPELIAQLANKQQLEELYDRLELAELHSTTLEDGLNETDEQLIKDEKQLKETAQQQAQLSKEVAQLAATINKNTAEVQKIIPLVQSALNDLQIGLTGQRSELRQMTNDLDLVYQALDEHGHKFLKSLEMVGAASLSEFNDGLCKEVNERVALAKERRPKELIKIKKE